MLLHGKLLCSNTPIAVLHYDVVFFKCFNLICDILVNASMFTRFVFKPNPLVRNQNLTFRKHRFFYLNDLLVPRWIPGRRMISNRFTHAFPCQTIDIESDLQDICTVILQKRLWTFDRGRLRPIKVVCPITTWRSRKSVVIIIYVQNDC